MRKPIGQITDKSRQEWVLNALDYLKTWHPFLSAKLCAALTDNGVLKPIVKRKGSFLLIPKMKLTDAFFLRSGYVKLYTIDPLNDDENLIHIWEPGNVITMCQTVKENAAQEEFYIKVMTDAELLCISGICLREIFKLHPELHLVAERVMAAKIERMLLHTGLLSITDKKRRYNEFFKAFPGLRNILNNSDTCRFLDISETILLSAKKEM